MSKTNLDKYDILLEILGKKNRVQLSASELDEQIDEVFELMDEIGIDYCQTDCRLVLWNDNINDFDFVAWQLIEILEIEHHQTMFLMKNAKENGRVVVMQGEYKELIPLSEKLKENDLTATIEIMKPRD